MTHIGLVGTFVGRRGSSAIFGRTFDMGPSALLDCDGMGVVVTSKRLQFADPAIVECFGLSMSQVRGLVVKSRGHFRAAVDEVFTDDRIMEVDVPGLTTPILDRVPFRHLPRPIYPLDTGTWCGRRRRLLDQTLSADISW